MPLSLVSRIFLPQCRRHIFSNIKIDNASFSAFQDRISGLASCLQRTDSFGEYVQEVSLRINAGNRDCMLWIRYYSYFPHIFRCLSKLRVFKLDFLDSVYWSEFEFDFRASISELLRLSSLSTLRLRNIFGMPISVLTSCPALKELNLSAILFNYSPDYDIAVDPLDNATLDQGLYALSLLRVNSPESFLTAAYPGSSLDLSNLRLLTLETSVDYAIMKNSFKSVFPSLEYLHLCDPRRFYFLISFLRSLNLLCIGERSLLEAFDISSLKHLRHVRISLATPRFHKVYDCLSTIAPGNNVDTIEVLFTSVGNITFRLSYASDDHYTKLDQLLTELGETSALRKVSFIALMGDSSDAVPYIDDEYISEVTQGNWKRELEPKFPQLLCSRKISFQAAVAFL